MLSIIVAMDAVGTIGRSDGGMPWHLPPDLGRFRLHTLGKAVVFGRKTWQAMGRTHLPRRYVRVLSRIEDESVDWTRFGPDWSVIGPMTFDDVLLVNSMLEEPPPEFPALQRLPNREIMIAGGREVYQQALPHAQRIYLTELDGTFEGDIKFPEWERSEWKEVSRERCLGDGPNAHPHTFRVLERAKP